MIDGIVHRLDIGSQAERLLVLLHGYGATEHDIASIVPMVDPAGRFVVVSPRGPIPTPGGGASWYDFDEDRRADPASFRATLARLDAFVTSVAERFDLDRADSVMGGVLAGRGHGGLACVRHGVAPAARILVLWHDRRCR
ncbi:MAG: hypothetical protein HYR89_02860 [Actinobacteria bacterium]|nr:hypothetical protein [Actinomycetota bacterium]